MSSTELNLTNWKGQESIDAIPSKDPMVVETVTNYVMKGELASTGFFRAMLENNFLTAVIRADNSNIIQIKSWAKWMINHVPECARGSKHLVDHWIRMGGINGRKENVPTEV